LAFALLAAVPAAAQWAGTAFADSYTLYVAGKAVGSFASVAGPSPEGLFAVSWQAVPNPDGSGGDGPYRLHVPSFAYFTAAGKPLRLPIVGRAMDAGPYDSGRARLLAADPEALYGYIDAAGAWAVPPRFAEARDFKDGYAAVRETGGLWGVIGPDGGWKLEPRFAAFVEAYPRGLFRFREAAGGPESYWDAAAGAPAPRGDGDPRRYAGSRTLDRWDGYSVAYGRRAHWGGLYAAYVDIAAPDGKILYPGVFTNVDQVVGKLGVVVFGYGGWYDGPQSYGRRDAAVGLFDLQAGKFLVPPICSQILPIGATTWYVRPHGGGAYLFDAATGKHLGPQPDADIVWIDGQVALGRSTPDAGFGYPTLAAGEVDLIGFVNDDKVRLRAAPATTAAIVAELSKGTRLAVRAFKPAVETIGDWTGLWTKVELEDGRSGWVFGYFLDLATYEGL
jgi:hypothetical protein